MRRDSQGTWSPACLTLKCCSSFSVSDWFYLKQLYLRHHAYTSHSHVWPIYASINYASRLQTEFRQQGQGPAGKNSASLSFVVNVQSIILHKPKWKADCSQCQLLLILHLLAQSFVTSWWANITENHWLSLTMWAILRLSTGDNWCGDYGGRALFCGYFHSDQISRVCHIKTTLFEEKLKFLTVIYYST